MFVTEHVVSPIISMSLYSKTDVVEGHGPNPAMYYNPQVRWMASQRILCFLVQQLLREGERKGGWGFALGVGGWLNGWMKCNPCLKTISYIRDSLRGGQRSFCSFPSCCTSGWIHLESNCALHQQASKSVVKKTQHTPLLYKIGSEGESETQSFLGVWVFAGISEV